MTPSDTRTRIPELARWYGTAALGALTVGATAADAQVVYTDIDDVVIQDTFDSGQSSPIEGPTIDFDGDGDAEMLIGEVRSGTYTIGLLVVDDDGDDQATGFIGNEVAGYGYFLPLDAGTEIGPASPELRDDDGAPSFTFQATDPNGFQGAGDTYIGIQFQIDTGTTHYGWVRVEMPTGGGSITVKDFAFEATPDTPIEAGATAPPPPPPPPPTATEPDALGEGYAFTPVAPNPVTGRSTFEVAVGRTQHVAVTVVDALGRTVRTLHDAAIAAGTDTEVAFDSGDLPTGIYVVRVVGETFDSTRTVTVVR